MSDPTELQHLADPWRADELVEAARRAFERLMDHKPLSWDGPELTWDELLISALPIDRHIANVERHRENGMDDIDVLFSVVLRIGMEQGARLAVRELRRAGLV